jgi:hypothetical protein
MRTPALALAAVAALLAPGSLGAAHSARVGTAGVTVVLPARWHAWEPPGNLPPVTDPRTRLVAVSAPFRFASRGCDVSAYAFPQDAVAIVVVEWVRIGRDERWRPRPSRFTATTLRLDPPPAIECFGGPGGSVEFADHGRRLGAYLLAGRTAGKALVDRARSVLDTLRVTNR